MQKRNDSIIRSNFEIFCDFDGTVTVSDTTDLLLEKLADPAWREIEEKWERGEIGSRECMGSQIALIRGGWTAVQGILDNVAISPGFTTFTRWCKDSGIPIYLISEAPDRVIYHILEREKITVDCVIANRLVEESDGSLSLQFPYGDKEGSCIAGVCKCALIRNAHQVRRVVIGDGQSDFCWADKSDLLFAKSKLAKYCRESQLNFHPFEDFGDIQKCLEEMTDKRSDHSLAQTKPCFA